MKYRFPVGSNPPFSANNTFKIKYLDFNVVIILGLFGAI